MNGIKLQKKIVQISGREPKDSLLKAASEIIKITIVMEPFCTVSQPKPLIFMQPNLPKAKIDKVLPI